MLQKGISIKQMQAALCRQVVPAVHQNRLYMKALASTHKDMNPAIAFWKRNVLHTLHSIHLTLLQQCLLGQVGLGTWDKEGTAWGCLNTVKTGLTFTFKVQEQEEQFTELHSENKCYMKGKVQRNSPKVGEAERKEKGCRRAVNSKHWADPELSMHFSSAHYWICCSLQTHTLFRMKTGFLSDLLVK